MDNFTYLDEDFIYSDTSLFFSFFIIHPSLFLMNVLTSFFQFFILLLPLGSRALVLAWLYPGISFSLSALFPNDRYSFHYLGRDRFFA